MALDRYMQLIPGYSSNRRQDNLGERTRKGVHSLVTPAVAVGGYDATGTKVVIGELLYEVTLAAPEDLTALPGYDAAGLNEVWLLTPEPKRLIDPFSVYAQVASGDPFLDSIVLDTTTYATEAEAAEAFDAAYSDNKFVVQVKSIADNELYINGAVFVPANPIAGSTHNDVLIGYEIVVNANVVDGDYIEFRANPYEIHNPDKTVDFTIGLEPAGDFEDTRGMLIAGTKIAYRDKSIRLGSSLAGADVEPCDTEEFHVFSRDTKSPTAKYTPAP